MMAARVRDNVARFGYAVIYLVTVVACFRDKDAFWLGAGLLLLLVAGYMPEATYHHLLVILGVGFLAGAFHIVEEASERAPATAPASG